jgi:hypothetical protein
LQREDETIQGYLRKQRAAQLRKLHQNAQRLLQALPVHNPFASQLTFPDESTRLRRDQQKYLTLIRAIALLHQHQRPRRQIEGVEHIEVTREDIAAANDLAGEILGRCLDEMPPQTRRFLELLWDLVKKAVAEKQIAQPHYWFSQREVRAFTGWSAPQVKRHLAKLVELEYLLVHRGARGQTFVYELLYQGEGRDGARFLPGLIDVAKLKGNAGDSPTASNSKLETHNPELPYDGDRDGQKADRDTPGMPQAHPKFSGGSTGENAVPTNNDAAQTPVVKKRSRKSQPGGASETQPS